MGKSPRKKPGVIALKVVCWLVGLLILVGGIAAWVISFYLSPKKLVEIIERESSDYLYAEVKIGNLDYKLFKTYPWLEFELDSVSVISKCLDNISYEQQKLLPVYSDSLAFIKTLKGSINLHDLLHKQISLKNLEISQPKLNIVIYNDSVYNYNIIKKTPAIDKMPKVDIAEIQMKAPLELTFLSVPLEMQGNTTIENFYLVRNDNLDWTIGLTGDIYGHYKDFFLPSKVPVSFETSLKLNYNDVSADIKDFNIDIAGLSFGLKGDINLSHDKIDVKNADVNLFFSNILDLGNFIPNNIYELIPYYNEIDGNLPLSLNLHLLSPFNFKFCNLHSFDFESIPSFEGNMKINEGELIFSPTGMKKINAENIFLNLEGIFYSSESSNNILELKELRITGEGIALDARANIKNLTGNIQNINGEVSFKTDLMETLSYIFPRNGYKLKGSLQGDIKVSGNAVNPGKNVFNDIEVKGEIKSKKLYVSSPNSPTINLFNIKGDFDGVIPSYPIINYKGTGLGFKFEADSIYSNSEMNELLMSGIEIKLDAMDTVSGNPDPNGDLYLKANNIRATIDNNLLLLENMSFNAKGALNSSGSLNNYAAISATHPGEDALIAERISHTPLVLTYQNGGLVQTVMSLLNTSVSVSFDKGKFETNSYLYPISFSKTDVTTDLNKVNLHSDCIAIGKTSFSINADFEGLKPFLTSYSPTMLKIKSAMNFNNVDINQLSWGYYGSMLKNGHERDSIFIIPPMMPFTKADSLCVAIPRNINADISLNSNSAEYMDFKFSPLSTKIIVKDGCATLSHLKVGAPYATAVVDWTYSTSSLANIFMDLKIKVEDFNFFKFYSVFPKLVEKSPEIKNLTGNINADVNCYFNMFPDMFMDSESLKSNFDIKGLDMEFAREGKIERITHLMLIEGDQPIKIHNFDINGSFHDNLLQINPFKINFDDYQLGFAGVNNMSGEMYYHLALEKSPFHLPFGVSVTGTFKHPEIKLGRTRIDDYKSETVSKAINNNININIMSYLKNGWLQFVQEAAKWEENKVEK